MTTDFGTYIDTDPDGEDSSCEVSREFSEHDFCETIGLRNLIDHLIAQ